MVKTGKKEDRIINLTIQVCGLLTIFLGSSAILGWIYGVPKLASFASGKIPMALSTAVLFVAFGFIILFYHRFPSSRILQKIGIALSYFGIFFSILLLYLSLSGIRLQAEHLGLNMSEDADGFIIGHMSPVTAFCFVLVGLSFLIILMKSEQKKLIKTSLIFAVLVFFIAIIFLLSYLLGTPLLYEGSFIPPAITTSLAFLFLSIALLLISGLKVWSKEELSNVLSTPYTYTYVLVFFVLILSIMTAGYSYYKRYEKHYRFGIEQDLSTIATLKVNQIVQWRKERLGDAKILYKNAEFSKLVRRFLNNQNDLEAKNKIQEWIDIVHSTYQYESISLHDLKGGELAASPIKKKHSHLFFPKLLSEIQKSGEIIFKDFYRDENDMRIYLAIFIPIQSDNNLIGILDLRLDPQQYLYPLINEWPTPSKTAETLIVRREGKEVVFLNELKFQKNTALNLRRPLTEINLAGASAALDKKEFIEGVDYRGIPVLAYVCPIPNSPWYLVARIDIAEVYAPLREWFWAIIILVVVLLTGLGTSIGLIWRNQRSKFHLERYQSTEKIRKLNRVYALLSDINGAIVRIRNSQELFVKVCDIAVEKGGFKIAWIGKINSQTKKIDLIASNGISDEYLKKIDFIYDEDESLFGVAGRAIKNGVHVISNDIQKDESILPLHKELAIRGCNSSAAFPLKVFGQVWGVFKIYSSEIGFFDEDELKLLDELAKDISFAIEFAEKEAESKHAWNRVIASEIRYRRLFESAKDGILILDAETGKIVDVNPFLIELLGYSKEEFFEKEVWEIEFFKNIVANKDKFTELQQKKYVRYDDLPLEASDGRKINVECVSNVYLVDQHKVIQCSIRDITERKRAEEALIEGEINFRTLSDSGQALVWTAGTDKLCNYFNKVWLQFTGRSLEQEMGNGWVEGVHPDDMQRCINIYVSAFDKLEKFSMEYRLRRYDGEYRWILDDGSPRYNSKGEFTGYIGHCLDITERKQAEEELNKFFNLVPDMVCVTHTDGRFIKINAAWEKVLNFTEKEILETRFLDLIHPDDREATMKEVAKQMEGGSTFNFINRYRCKDGSYKWLEWVVSPAEHKTVLYAAARDITERKRVEKSLRVSEERFRSLYENSTIGLYRTTPGGIIILANASLVKMLGYSSFEELAARNLEEDGFEPTYERKVFLEQIEKNGEVKGLESAWTSKNGSEVFLRESAKAIRDSNGRTLYYDGTVEDITERKRAEQELLKLSRAVEQSPASVIITDTKGNIEYINPKVTEITGYQLAEVLGKNPRIFTSGEKPKSEYKILWDTITLGNEWRGEFHNKKKNGELYWEFASISAIVNEKGETTHYLAVKEDITERKRVEEALKESQSLYSSFIEQLPNPVFRKDYKGRYVLVNSQFCKLKGLKKEDFLGRTPREVASNELERQGQQGHATKYADEGEDVHELIIRTGKIIETEEEYPGTNRSKKFMYVVRMPVMDFYGKITGTQGILSDITERKKSENELRKLSRAIEQSPASIIITDTEGNIEYINKKVTEISGYRPEEVIGKNPRIFTSGEKTKTEYKTLWNTITSGSEWRGEFHNKKKNGEFYWEFATISPILNREGVITNYLAVKEDITQSKKDQAEISRMANVLGATPDLVGMAYPNGDVFYLNRGGRLLMQIPASEDITKLSIRDFHPEEISLLIIQKGLPIAKDRGYWSAETRIITRTGEEIPVLQNIISHKNFENVVTHYSTIIRDIREIKKMEENLKEAKEKAEQSDNLKTEFLAQMSHEIRSPMNAIISFATLLKEDLSKDLSPDHLEYFAGIDTAGRRLIRTVELIINAAELQVGTYTLDFSDIGLIGEILTRISSEYKLLAEEKGLTFNFRSNIEEAVIEGDKESIYQVFVNLMDNAVKYTHEGSVSINVEKNEDAQEVKVTIEDSGIGISQEFLDQMFEPFTQEDKGYSRRYEGNGLGLSLVKKYCELNGITIEVESKKGIGSKFTLIVACKK